MRKRFLLLVVLIMGISFVFVAKGIFAAAKIPDVIQMNTKEYSKHKRPIVAFDHKKHAEDFAKKHPDFFKNGCGECHHDANNKPLKNLKPDDKVQLCIECHKTPGEKPSKEKLSKKEKIKKYQAEAVHENCHDCHRKYDRANKLKSKDKGYAPTKARCNDCHKK